MYTKIESRFWKDEKVRKISEDARYLFLYLLTSPHRNLIGLYFLPIPYACFDLGWDEKRFRKGLGELLQEGFVEHDPENNIVFIRNYLKYNPLENSNQVKSAISKLEELPDTPLLESLKAALEEQEKPFLKPLVERLQERLGKGFGKGFGKPVTVYSNSNSNSIKENTVHREADASAGCEQPAALPNASFSQPEDSKVPGNGKVTEQIKEVFNFYNEIFQDCWARPLLLTEQRRKKIAARLKRFSVEELKTAIRNIRASPFHCGENDKGRVYATPEFVFRSDEMVDRWLKERAKTGGLRGYNPPKVME